MRDEFLGGTAHDGVPEDGTAHDGWACPRCDHALVPFYRRPLRRAFNKEHWRGCVDCDYRRVEVNQDALTVPLPVFLAALIVASALVGLAAVVLGTVAAR